MKTEPVVYIMGDVGRTLGSGSRLKALDRMDVSVTNGLISRRVGVYRLIATVQRGMVSNALP
jgi:hypothetical protein